MRIAAGAAHGPFGLAAGRPVGPLPHRWAERILKVLRDHPWHTTDEGPRVSRTVDDRADREVGASRPAGVSVAGALVAGGWAVAVVATLFHPGGQEDDHPLIFVKYADSAPWVAVHLVQFVGVLVALGGVVVLHHLLRTSGWPAVLGRLAAASAVATAAVWAVLQGLDGVALKQAVDAWQSAPAGERPLRFATAETVRWLEWGFQSYFRLLLGVTFLLSGAALLAGRVLVRSVGWVAVAAGLLSVAIAVDVGYHGLASGLQSGLGVAFLGAGLAYAVGLMVAGRRAA